MSTTKSRTNKILKMKLNKRKSQTNKILEMKSNKQNPKKKSNKPKSKSEIKHKLNKKNPRSCITNKQSQVNLNQIVNLGIRVCRLGTYQGKRLGLNSINQINFKMNW
jgi:predicted Fe-Mo cluster-binding NifX family protein